MTGNNCKDIEIVLSTVTSSLGNTFVIFVYVAFRQIAHCLKYLEMKILEKILSLFCPSWRYSVCTNLKNKFPFMNVALLLSFVVGLSLAWAFKIWHDKGISQYKILDMHLNTFSTETRKIYSSTEIKRSKQLSLLGYFSSSDIIWFNSFLLR